MDYNSGLNMNDAAMSSIMPFVQMIWVYFVHGVVLLLTSEGSFSWVITRGGFLG